MGEFDTIDRLFLSSGYPDDKLTEVANGDDASVHNIPPGESLVVSCDSALCGVHWPHNFDLSQAAERAVQAAFSDLAAMGATPRWCWVALMASDSDALATMGQGVKRALAAIDVTLAGGDCVQAPTNGLTVTVAGSVASGSAMRRNGAKVGDGVWLLGAVGLAAAGLRQWQQGRRDGGWLDHFAGVRARLNEGQALQQMGVRCCIDVSDGLAQDANHLARASGVRLSLQVDAILQLQPLLAAWDDGLDLLLSGGEDYALLCCAGPQLDTRLSELGGINIGSVEAGSGLAITYRNQSVTPNKQGFDHFATAC